MESNFAVFILTHGRPDNVKTFNTLKRSGYTGPLYLIVDDLDKTKDDYIAKFGEDAVIVFDKKAVGEITDSGDNFGHLRSVLFARNASFKIARYLGIEYFITLDDDYHHFQYRFGDKFFYSPKGIKNFDAVLSALLDFYISSGITTLAIAQGGDFIGGDENAYAKNIKATRKAMNFFICSVHRPFQFVARMNDDVTTYVKLSSTGSVFLTTNQLSLEQAQTQTSAGGLTELYLDYGTYVKSFYSVMFHPSSVVVRPMGDRGNYRLHHSIAWKNTTPMILSETYKKV